MLFDKPILKEARKKYTVLAESIGRFVNFLLGFSKRDSGAEETCFVLRLTFRLCDFFCTRDIILEMLPFNVFFSSYWVSKLEFEIFSEVF